MDRNSHLLGNLKNGLTIIVGAGGGEYAAWESRTEIRSAKKRAKDYLRWNKYERILRRSDEK